MVGPEIERLVQLLSRLPGLGPRSARRIALHLIEKKDVLLKPLAQAMDQVTQSIKVCSTCGNFDSTDPCAICADSRRQDGVLCVVHDVASLWALERSGAFHGRYHVLGGLLSALDGVGPEDLAISKLLKRLDDSQISEIILATPATVEGQTTAHYVADQLAGRAITVSALAHGVPVGGELEYLDDGTISAALRARRRYE